MLNRIRRLLGRPELHRVPKIRFLGEQDGNPERELKAKLCPVLRRRPLVDRAYLAQVAYAGVQEVAVALCIVGPVAPDLAAEIGSEFRKQFATGVPLDILFISTEQDATLVQVCKPFFVRPVGTSSNLNAG
jgi:hypothetical protein